MKKPRSRNKSISFSLLCQWQVKRRNGHTLRAYLKETLHQEPIKKWRPFFGEMPIYGKKCLPFQTISGHFCAKNLLLGFSLVLNHLLLNVNQRSEELRWLVRVGMFLHNECLLKNTLEVSRMKVQGGAMPPPSADAHVCFVLQHCR